MRILLRNHLTGLYYVGLNHIGREHERGLDFGNVRSAAKFTFEEKLPDMEIILRYDSCDGEIPLPVLAEWCLFEERALRLEIGEAIPAVPCRWVEIQLGAGPGGSKAHHSGTSGMATSSGRV